MRTFAALAVALGLSAPAAAAAAPDDLGDAIVAFEKRLEEAPGPTERALAVHEIGLKRHPRVAAALKPHLRHADLEVRVAVAKVIGEQRDPSVAPLLVTAFDREEGAKDPSRALLAALLEGIGESDPGGCYKSAEKAARKWHDIDPEVARSAARAMAASRTARAVEDLIALMERSEAMVISNQDNEHWKNAYEFTSDFIAKELHALTGRDIKNVKSWKDWWRENRKTWRPPLPGEEAGGGPGTDSDLWTDPAGKFTVRRPSDSWKWREAKTLTMWAEKTAEGRPVAEFYVVTRAVNELASQTAGAMADEMKPRIEEDMKDIRKEGTRWGFKTKFAGESAVIHEVFGRHKEYDVCFQRHVYLVRDGVLYRVMGKVKASRGDPLWKEFDEFFASFRFARK